MSSWLSGTLKMRGVEPDGTSDRTTAINAAVTVQDLREGGNEVQGGELASRQVGDLQPDGLRRLKARSTEVETTHSVRRYHLFDCGENASQTDRSNRSNKPKATHGACGFNLSRQSAVERALTRFRASRRDIRAPYGRAAVARSGPACRRARRRSATSVLFFAAISSLPGFSPRDACFRGCQTVSPGDSLIPLGVEAVEYEPKILFHVRVALDYLCALSERDFYVLKCGPIIANAWTCPVRSVCCRFSPRLRH